jgi:hypothetical protein
MDMMRALPKLFLFIGAAMVAETIRLRNRAMAMRAEL